MLTYMEQLRRQSDNKKPVTKTTKEEYTPLEEQITLLMSTLPLSMQQRNWSMSDLMGRLHGKFRAKPHAMKVAEALRKLGWTCRRDYSRAGGGARVWRQNLLV